MNCVSFMNLNFNFIACINTKGKKEAKQQPIDTYCESLIFQNIYLVFFSWSPSGRFAAEKMSKRNKNISNRCSASTQETNKNYR